VSWLALIPARAGSKRIAAKNVRSFGGHPLLAYAIAAARASGVFSRVVVSTDSGDVAAIARHYGAETPFLRPPDLAGDLAPDIGWVRHALGELPGFEIFALLRPTSPFRTAATIRRAAAAFTSADGIDSLRAVEPCRQHPGKMWIVEGARMRPLLAGGPADPPWHSTPYQGLPLVHVQNASLEIAWTRVVARRGTIAGEIIAPFLTTAHEGFDLNTPEDWIVAEHLLATGAAVTEPVAVAPQ
jgi:N-acylneuraminate cytidylyltransferase